MGDLNIIQKRIFELPQTFTPVGAEEYSNKIIPNTLNWFNTTYSNVTPTTTDITVYKAYNPDGVHPHSDVTGAANRVYARIITEFINKI